MIQDSLFILEYKLGFSEFEIMNLERWVLKKRIKQFLDYQKKKAQGLKEAVGKSGKLPSFNTNK